MKKFFIFSILAAMFLTACNKDNAEDTAFFQWKEKIMGKWVEVGVKDTDHYYVNITSEYILHVRDEREYKMRYEFVDDSLIYIQRTWVVNVDLANYADTTAIFFDVDSNLVIKNAGLQSFIMVYPPMYGDLILKRL